MPRTDPRSLGLDTANSFSRTSSVHCDYQLSSESEQSLQVNERKLRTAHFQPLLAVLAQAGGWRVGAADCSEMCRENEERMMCLKSPNASTQERGNSNVETRNKFKMRMTERRSIRDEDGGVVGNWPFLILRRDSVPSWCLSICYTSHRLAQSAKIAKVRCTSWPICYSVAARMKAALRMDARRPAARTRQDVIPGGTKSPVLASASRPDFFHFL